MTKTTRRPSVTRFDSAVHQLRRASQAVSAVWQRHMADLTTPQFGVLYVLAEHGELCQSELGALTSLDTSTLTPLLDRLEGRGLISKIIDPTNRRRRQIALTETGLQLLNQAHAQAAKTEVWIDEVLGETKARQLVDMLRALGDARPGLSTSGLDQLNRTGLTHTDGDDDVEAPTSRHR